MSQPATLSARSPTPFSSSSAAGSSVQRTRTTIATTPNEVDKLYKSCGMQPIQAPRNNLQPIQVDLEKIVDIAKSRNSKIVESQNQVLEKWSNRELASGNQNVMQWVSELPPTTAGIILVSALAAIWILLANPYILGLIVAAISGVYMYQQRLSAAQSQEQGTGAVIARIMINQQTVHQNVEQTAQELTLKLGGILKDVAVIGANRDITITNIQNESFRHQVDTVHKMHSAQMDRDVRLANIENDGSIRKQQIQSAGEESVAKINSDAQKFVADKKFETERSAQKTNLEMTKISEESKTEIARQANQIKLQMEQLQNQTRQAEIKHQTEEAKAKLESNERIESDRQKHESDRHAATVDADKAKTLADIEKERYKIEQENKGCVIC